MVKSRLVTPCFSVWEDILDIIAFNLDKFSFESYTVLGYAFKASSKTTQQWLSL